MSGILQNSGIPVGKATDFASYSEKYRAGISKYLSMTCDVRPQLAEVQCAVAHCNVLAEPILLVTCDVRACASSGLPQYRTFLAIMKELTIEINFLLV